MGRPINLRTAIGSRMFQNGGMRHTIKLMIHLQIELNFIIAGIQTTTMLFRQPLFCFSIMDSDITSISSALEARCGLEDKIRIGLFATSPFM